MDQKLGKDGWRRVMGVSRSVSAVEARRQSYSSALLDACMNGLCRRCRCCVPQAEAEADGRCASRRSRRHTFDSRCQKSEPHRSTPLRQLLYLPLYMSPSTNGFLSRLLVNGGDPYERLPLVPATASYTTSLHRCLNSPHLTSRPLALR
jgi:hypothetical protein